MTIRHLFFNTQKRAQDLMSAAGGDGALFEGITDDLTDFGYKIDFSFFGGAGAYHPHILATQALDNPQKRELFSNAFLAKCDEGLYPARFKILRYLSFPEQLFTFLHELMHFYQDMNGLYYAPLREEGIFPVVPELRGRVILTLFNECQAVCESIRAARRLADAGRDAAWRGALLSKDWRNLGRVYGENLSAGMQEAQAALLMREQWYNTPQREFYEREALEFFSLSFSQYEAGGARLQSDKLRGVRLEDLFARMPEEGTLSYLRAADVQNPLYFEIKSPLVLKAVEDFESRYGRAENMNIQDIRCGSAPYLWHRIMSNARETSEIPAQAYADMQGQSVSF